MSFPIESFLYPIQEFCPDNASSSPDRGDVSVIEVPVELFAGCFEQGKSLGVGNNFRSVESIAHSLDKSLPIALVIKFCRARQLFRCSHPLVFHSGQDARFYGRIDRGYHDRLFDRGLQCPTTGPFLSCFIQDDVDQRFASVRVCFGENVCGDFDQETVQVTTVPIRENIM